MIQCLRWRWGVVQLAAQRPLEPLILVRVQAPQLYCLLVMISGIEEDPPEENNEKNKAYELRLSNAPCSFIWL